jgi:hypothetical protein
LKESLWGEVCEGKNEKAGNYEENKKYGVSATVCTVFNRSDFFPIYM